MRVVTQGRRDGAGGTSWPGQRAEAKKVCGWSSQSGSLVGMGSPRTLSTVRSEYGILQSSPRSPPVLATKSLDVTRLLQARSRIPNPLVASPWHNRAFWLACPRLDNIPRLHAPELLTDLTTCTPLRTASILWNRISNHQVRTSPPVPQVPNLRGEASRPMNPWPLYRFQLECRI